MRAAFRSADQHACSDEGSHPVTQRASIIGSVMPIAKSIWRMPQLIPRGEGQCVVPDTCAIASLAIKSLAANRQIARQVGQTSITSPRAVLPLRAEKRFRAPPRFESFTPGKGWRMRPSAVPTSEIAVETHAPFDRASALREQSVNEVVELLRRAGFECELMAPSCSSGPPDKESSVAGDRSFRPLPRVLIKRDIR
jgi:hypothetical protein